MSTIQPGGVSTFFARFKRQVALGLCCVMAAGLFLWFKLRLVTGMPRSAYAVPEEAPKAQPQLGQEAKPGEAESKPKDALKKPQKAD